MGIKRGICWVLVIALLLPLFPVLSVSAVGADDIVQEDAAAIAETESKKDDNKDSEAFPVENEETDEGLKPIVIEEKTNESSNEKHIKEETEDTQEAEDAEKTLRISETLEIPQISQLQLYDSNGEEIEMHPDFSSECNAYTVTTQEDTLRLYAVFSNNSSLRVDGFNIVENTGVMNQEIDLNNALDIDTGLSHITLQLTYIDETSHEVVARSVDIAVSLETEEVNVSDAYAAVMEDSIISQLTNQLWLTDASFMAYGSNQHPFSLIEFDPSTTAYTVDISSSASARIFKLTASEQAVAAGVYYQFLLDDVPVTSTAGGAIEPQKITSTEEINASRYCFNLRLIPMGTTHVVKLLVGPLADGATNLVESDCNVYSFTINRTIGLSGLVVHDSDNSEVSLDPAFHAQINDYTTEVKGETISIKTSFVAGIKTYVGNSTEPADSGTTNYAWTKVNLADYTAKDSDVAIIPIRAEYEKDGSTHSSNYQLSVKWTDPVKKYTPVIKTTSEDVVTDKNKKVEISVEIEPIDGNGTVSYQWYWRRGSSRPNAIWDSQNVDGAEESIFSPSTAEAQTNIWYACRITYTTADKQEYVTDSKFIHVTVNLGKPNGAVIVRQPGTFTMVNKIEVSETPFKNTYKAGSYCDTIYIAVASKEAGTDRTYTWYYNKTNTNTGGTELTTQAPTTYTGGGVEYTGFKLNKAFEAGEYYLYCVIRNTDQADATNYSEVASETCKVIFEALDMSDFDGEGTQESPFLLKTVDDLLTLWKRVNEDGVPYTNVYFRMVADITLPKDWTPIGCTKDGSTDIQKGANLNAFSGTIDGENHLLTVPADGLPLLGYVRDATVKNLNIKGERIAGAGLVNNYTGPDLHGNAITIENVCLKNGTKTLKSGLVQGVFGGNQYSSATADFTVTIRNCTAEDGVVIGYTGTESRIGTFANKINGTIENCTSYATVKGKNYVGGLIGTMDNAMGKCTVRNSSFHGTVSGSNYVGGIIGGGYSNDNSAPNGGRPNLIGNTVDGTVTGGSCVGGITGGDQYVAQTRANVAHSVTGNTFTGTVSGSQYVGGIIGYYNSLNVYDNVAGNKYSGADKGVGYVKYIDTSYKNPKLMDGTVAFNTGKTTVGLPDVQWNTWKEGLNRDDDPLGVDAENLARKIGGSSQPACIELTVSGNYKTEYDFGENLDLTGIILTASWDDGTTSTVSLDDVKISGYDKNKTGEQTVILTYGAAKAYITVRVTPKSSKITVNVSILGDKKHGSTSAPHGLARGGLTTWASESNVEADTAETVWDVLQRVAQKHGITFTADSNNAYGTVYIKAVNDLGEFDNGKNSGWMYTVNGTHPEKGVAARYLKNGDTIILHYTDDYTYEEGGDNYGKTPPKGTTTGGGSTGGTTTGGTTGTTTGGTSMITAADRNKAAAVDKLIEKIGTVTKDSGPAIEAARKAYNDLTPTQKRLVNRLKELTDAEKAYAKLTATAEDQKKAQEVMDKIKKIGNVTKDSKQDIRDARKAYDALTDLQKLLVDNYDVLTAAETKFAMLDTLGKVSEPYISTGEYMEKLGTPSVGAIGGEWMVIGLARSGRTVPGVEDYYQKAVEYVQQSIDPDTGRLHKAKSTDNARMILALTAIGKDVTNVGGHNLLQGLSDLEYVKYQGNNGPIWALLALDSGNYPVPSGGTTTRQALIDEILSVQTSDGGWAISGDRADSDMTGMALTALAPYYKKDPAVKQAIDKAIARLSEMQDDDGGFSTTYGDGKYIATSESTAQVLTALSALSINADTDSRFVKNGSSVVDALLRYYVNGGGFKHVMDGEIDGMGTEQAYYALTAYYRFLSGKTNLYDMTDIIDMGGDVVTVEPTVPAATEPAQAAQTNIPWWIIAVCIFGGAGWGVVIGIVLVPKLNKKKD